MNVKLISTLALATASILSVGAATIAGFDDGTGTSSYDQFRGTAGGGWEAGWVDGTGAVNAGASGVVSNSSPVNGGGNYLTISDTDGTGSNNFSGYQRELSLTSPGVDLYTTYTLSLDIRMESAVNSGTQVVFWNSGDGAGLGGPNGFETRAFDSGGSVQWTFRDGANRVESGVDLIQGHTYNFNLTLYGTVDNLNTTYDITITDLDNSATDTRTGLTYRNAGGVYDGDPMIYFGAASRDTTGVTTASFSIDNISFATVPEPSSILMVGMGLVALIGFRRRR